MQDVLLENLKIIRDKMGDRPVTLLAVTKTVPLERINIAITEGGVRYIGENRVQELLSKYDGLARRDELHIHLIGRLQTNKVKYIIDKVDLIQSVDSLRLIDEIQKQAAKINKIQNVLVEINIGGEDSKGGILPADLPDFLSYLKQQKNISWKGLMCVPPISDNEQQLFAYFTEMKKLLVDNIDKKLDNINNYILSMGMSNDYEVAMNAGSTMIRVGSALFGARKY